MACVPALVATAPLDSTADPQESAFSAMLDRVPASRLPIGGSGMLFYVDATVPGAELDRMDIAPQLFGPYCYGDKAAECVAEAGFSPADIDREIAIMEAPHDLVIAETSVSADTITSALESDPLWSGDLELVESAAAPYWRWGTDDGATDPVRMTPLHSLGRGGQLALLGDGPVTVVRTLFAEDMDLALATASADEPSALDEGPFSGVADILDGTVVQAIGVPTPTMVDPLAGSLGDITSGTIPSISDIQATIDATRLPVPYLSLFVAEVAEGGAADTQILVGHLDAASAEANADAAARLLEAQFADAEITTATEGSTLVVTIGGPDHFRPAFDLLMQRQLLPA